MIDDDDDDSSLVVLVIIDFEVIIKLVAILELDGPCIISSISVPSKLDGGTIDKRLIMAPSGSSITACVNVVGEGQQTVIFMCSQGILNKDGFFCNCCFIK